jgi:uridine kinase
MLIISIGGGSASGKTTLAKELHASCLNSFLLSQDHYTKDVSHLTIDEISEYNFDHPEAVHGNILEQNISELFEFGVTKLPEYDFITAKCELFKKEVFKPDILIVEGIFALHFEKVREISHIKVFVDAAEDVRLSRRVKRDQIERGNTEEQIIDRFLKFVKPAHDLFIEPQKEYCDIIIDSFEMEEGLKSILAKIKELKK